MPDDDMPSTRPGSAVDLSRRIERLEHKYDDLAATIARVELNQQHGDELNRLRFDALDNAVKATSLDLKGFMARIEGLISGETETVQSRQGRELVADYQKWRATVDDRLDANDIFSGQIRLIGRLGVLLVTSQLLTLAAAAYALLHQ